MKVSARIFDGIDKNELIGKPITRDGKIVGKIVSISEDFWFGEIFDEEMEQLLIQSNKFHPSIVEIEV